MATRIWSLHMRQGGVEPTSPPYQSGVLPLNYRRVRSLDHFRFMGQVGIEPTPAALQTAALPVSCRPVFPSSVARTAEGEGFEPSSRLAPGSALAMRRLEPLSQPSMNSAEGEGLEPPRLDALPVFETGALPVRLTLRLRSHRSSMKNRYS